MAASIESSVVINRPVEEVFAFISDPESNLAAIDAHVESVEKTTEGPIGSGTTFRVRQKTPPFGRPRDTTVTFTAVEPNRRIETEGKLGPISPTGALTFEEADGGTRVMFRGEPNPVGVLKLITPVIVRQGQKIWDKRLARMKSVLEHRGS